MAVRGGDERLDAAPTGHDDLSGRQPVAHQFATHGLRATPRQCRIVSSITDAVGVSCHLDVDRPTPARIFGRLTDHAGSDKRNRCIVVGEENLMTGRYGSRCGRASSSRCVQTRRAGKIVG